MRDGVFLFSLTGLKKDREPAITAGFPSLPKAIHDSENLECEEHLLQDLRGVADHIKIQGDATVKERPPGA